MSADKFVDVLRDEGVHVEEHPGWRANNRNHKGRWGGVNGVVIHHTAGRNSLALCFKGTAALPGPLCHTHLAKDGTATMVGNGRANHAGLFTQNAHTAVVNESKTHPRPSGPEVVDGNTHYYGIEIENMGDGKDYYPAVQYDAAVRWAAAICRRHGWSAQSVIGHKEGTTRKIDPKGPIGSAKGRAWNMDTFRADVQKRLDGKAGDKPPAKTPAAKPATSKTKTTVTKPTVSLSAVVHAARRDPGLPDRATTHKSDVLPVERALHAEGLLPGSWADGSFGTLTIKAYAKWQRRLGFRGKDADGIPGRTTLESLGRKHGFTVSE